MELSTQGKLKIGSKSKPEPTAKSISKKNESTTLPPPTVPQYSISKDILRR